MIRWLLHVLLRRPLPKPDKLANSPTKRSLLVHGIASAQPRRRLG